MIRIFLSLSILFFFLHSGFKSSGQTLETSHLQWNLATYNQSALTSNHFSHITFDYRQANLSQNIQFKNASFWGDYPILQRDRNIGAIFLSLENESSGSENKFKKFKSNFAISKKVEFNSQSFFGFGLGFEYQQQTLSLGNLTTGSQFIEGLGFNRSLENGENSDFYKSTYFAINSGLFLQAMDYQKTKIMKMGISVNNINKPIKNWEGIEYSQPLLWSAQFQFLTFATPKFAIGPDAYFFKEGTAFNGIGGVQGRYYLGKSVSASFDEEYDNQYVNIFSRFATQRKMILGMQYRNQNYLIGFSSDIPFGGLDSNYQNAVEILLAFTPTIKSKSRSKAKKEKEFETKSNNEQKETTPKQKPKVSTDSVKTEAGKVIMEEKTDSIQSDQNKNITKMQPGGIISNQMEIPVKINPVYFVFGSSYLDLNSRKYLDQLYHDYLKDNKVIIKLTGHTDNIGSNEYNQKLSEQRAAKVKDYLVKLGIPEGNILTEGKGNDDPTTPNHDDHDRARNRRVEIEIVK